jgi:hypothetical protein
MKKIKKWLKGAVENAGTQKWLKAAGIRAARTIAQSALATIGTSAVLGEVNWLVVGSSAALAGIISILTSVVTGLPEVNS